MKLRIPRAAVVALWVLTTTLAVSAAQGQEPPPPHYRTLPLAKVLYLGDLSTRELLAEKLRAKLPANVTFAPVFYNDHDVHQLADKPLEQTKEQVDAIANEGRAFLEANLARLKEFDVVFTQFAPSSADPSVNTVVTNIQKRLVEFVHNGGKLIIIDHPAGNFAGAPLAEIMPCKSTENAAWTTTCEGSTDHPFSRGLPFEVTGSHTWGAIYDAIDAACVPLTRGQSNRVWLRTFPGGGQTVYLYEIYGQTWKWMAGANADAYVPDRPDDAAVWDAFLPRLVYGLIHGDRAFPVIVKLDLQTNMACRAGDKLVVPVDVENRSEDGRTVTVELEIGDRRSREKIKASRQVSLKKNERTITRFEAEVDLPCADNYLQVRARVLDANSGALVSESCAWVKYQHHVPLKLLTNRAAYRPGEAIEVTINDGSDVALPSGAALSLFIVDHEGRILQARDGVGALVMPDRGPKMLACYWVTTVVHTKERILGTARTQVQLDQPWTMRDQMQWSVWTNKGDARTLDLFRDAGINTLGCEGNTPAADRFGLRQYTEGTDFNTFGVTIDHDNWQDLRASMEKIAAERERTGGPASRSSVLVSLGEESGFKTGWGRRYYWDEDRAPAIPQKVFDDYLAERYRGDIAALNREWGSDFKSFDEIPLEKSKVKAPEQVFVSSQSWEVAERAGKASRDTFPVELTKVDPNQKYLAKTAQYYESYSFFDWYYQKYCDLAMEVYRTQRNPVSLSIMSAPGGFYPKVDVYGFGGLGPHYPKDYSLATNAIARRDYGDSPGFGLLWSHHNLRPLWSATVLSSLLAGNSHIDYWVDFGLNFNPDLTHTRASLWTRVLTSQTRPIEPILLHRQFAYTKGLGMYVAKQVAWKGIVGEQFGGGISPHTGVYSALEESGYMPKVVNATDLKEISVLVASHAQLVSPEEGKQLTEFVRAGGMLIATPWLASCSPHGNMLSVYPAAETGLAELLGFKLVNTSQQVRREQVTCGDLILTSKGRDQVIDISPDVKVATRYPDGTPLILTRTVGGGRIVYLNLIHDIDAWWSLHEPGREAFRKLVHDFIRSDGRVTPEYFVEYQAAAYVEDNKGWGLPLHMDKLPQSGAAAPWWSSQLFSDPSGRIKYLGIFSDHRSPQITALVRWARGDVSFFDLLKGEKRQSVQGRIDLTLRPGEAVLWAITPEIPDAVRLTVPNQTAAGQSIKINIASPSAAGVTLDVLDPSGRRSRGHSVANVQLSAGEAKLEIPIAHNDPAGEYRVIATECMTRMTAESRFTVTRSSAIDERFLETDVLTPFPKRSSDEWPPPSLSSEEFIDNLRRLTAIYTGTHEGAEAKYMLSYYLYVPFRGENRHALMRRLQRGSWAPHRTALANALRAGETFCLVGEDLNIDPLSGTLIDPYAKADPRQFIEDLATLPGVNRERTRVNAVTLDVIRLGSGKLVIVPDASVDREAYQSTGFAAWHHQIKAALDK